MRRIFGLTVCLLSVVLSLSAQEVRHEITIQGSGLFPKQTSSDGLTSKPTSSGGVMGGYRFHINKWLAVEGDYDYFRNSQRFFGSGGEVRVATNVHGVTGAGIVKLPSLRNMSPFLLAGGGALIFDPRDNAAVARQTIGAFLYGGGFDVPATRHVAVRVQYRGFLYKVPDFEVSSLKVDNFTHSAVPSAGLVFSF